MKTKLMFITNNDKRNNSEYTHGNYFIGKPRNTKVYTSEQLEVMGYDGIYQKNIHLSDFSQIGTLLEKGIRVFYKNNNNKCSLEINLAFKNIGVSLDSGYNYIFYIQNYKGLNIKGNRVKIKDFYILQNDAGVLAEIGTVEKVKENILSFLRSHEPWTHLTLKRKYFNYVISLEPQPFQIYGKKVSESDISVKLTTCENGISDKIFNFTSDSSEREICFADKTLYV